MTEKITQKTIDGIVGGITAAKSRIDELGKRLHALQTEREKLRCMTLGKDDFLRAMMEGVDYNSRLAKLQLKKKYKESRPAAHQLDDLRARNLNAWFPIGPFIGLPGYGVDIHMSAGLYFRDLIEIGLKKIIDEMEAENAFVKNTMTYDERCARMAEIDVEIPEIEDEMGALIDAMHEAGLRTK